MVKDGFTEDYVASKGFMMWLIFQSVSIVCVFQQIHNKRQQDKINQLRAAATTFPLLFIYEKFI